MTYQEFLSRVQSRSGLSSHEVTVRAVTATLETLREYLEGSGVDELPQELRQLVPAELLGAGSGQPDNVAGAAGTTNPQLAGETRAESGGESTAESGQ